MVDAEAAGPWCGEEPDGGSPPCYMPRPLHTVFPLQLVPRRSDLPACRLLTQVEAGSTWSPRDMGATVPGGHRGPKEQVEVGGRWWHLTPGDPEPNGAAEGGGQAERRQPVLSSPKAAPLPHGRLSLPAEEAVHRKGVKLAGFRVTGGVPVPAPRLIKCLHLLEPQSAHL